MIGSKSTSGEGGRLCFDVQMDCVLDFGVELMFLHDFRSNAVGKTLGFERINVKTFACGFQRFLIIYYGFQNFVSFRLHFSLEPGFNVLQLFV